MRIIAGTAGSQPINVPRNLTRPTTDRVREAVFSSLGEQVIDARVLDLFAGSGSLGIEALSRGAASATFVDSSEDACRIISENLRKTRLNGGTVQKRSISAFLSSNLTEDNYDLVFADPPYARDEETAAQVEDLLQNAALQHAISAEGRLVVESFAKAPLPDSPLWEVAKEKIYGKTRVSFLTPQS
ncbi:MAG: 16S rRNA (guanine(966)-N(2))-methyltransferase RsmD [Verrucomicrobiales bacterium]|nr:16S rRNA (guanine(966)-N(2))-methyltransferase RsmD [Verrucomicrobiales bacterium]